MTDPVIIGIATFDGPGRRESLLESLESLAPQAEMIHVYASDHTPVTPFENVYAHVNTASIGDAGKFYSFAMLEMGSYYCLTCDDDLIYPPDYVERMIEGIERYDRKAVCSFHGKAFTGKAYPWYRAQGERYPCLRTVDADAQITIPGTGVMGWHSSLLSVSMEDFPEPNMADIWFGKKCNDLGIPRYALAHQEGWIQHADIDMDTTLWRVNKKDTEKTDKITEVYNSVNWKL